jgi:hypothetical protein
VSRKVQAVTFWAFLALGVGLGAPYDPRQTEDIVRIMNETKIEVVLEKDDGPPEGCEIKPIALRASDDDARRPEEQATPAISWRARLKRFLKVS